MLRSHRDVDNPQVADLLEILRQPIDRSKVTKHPGAGANYMNVTDIKDALDWLLGPERWTWRVQEGFCMPSAPYYVVIGVLTLVGSDGEHAQTGCGAEPLWDHMPQPKERGGKVVGYVTKAYGDPSTNAEASALRRAAEAHGFGRELWRK